MCVLSLCSVLCCLRRWLLHCTDHGSVIWPKTLMELIFNLCGEFRWCPEGPVSQIHSPHLHIGVPGIFSDLLRSVQMLKREWCVESNGKLRSYSIPGKTATLVPEFAVEDLPSAEPQPRFLHLQWRTYPWAEPWYLNGILQNGTLSSFITYPLTHPFTIHQSFLELSAVTNWLLRNL